MRQLMISPTLLDQAKVMFSLMEEYGWEQFSVVYSSESGYAEFISAIKLLVRNRNVLIDNDNSHSRGNAVR